MNPLTLSIAVLSVLSLSTVVAAKRTRPSSRSSASVTDTVYFELEHGGEPIGRIEFGLFGDVVPQTAENFKQLTTGENGYGYKGTIFHRIIKGFMAQGGDIDHQNGRGGRSIYGPTFPDENFKIKHTKAGLLSMANRGPNTGSSQFFITFAPTSWLDGRHVVFGQVTSGMDVLRYLENAPTGAQDKPSKDIVVVDCGKVEPIDVDGDRDL